MINFCQDPPANIPDDIVQFCARVLGSDGLGNGFGTNNRGWEIFVCIIIGLAGGIMIGEATEYSTSYAYAPTT